MKFNFAGLYFASLRELRGWLNEGRNSTDELIASEMKRVFEMRPLKDDLLDWLDWQRESDVCSLLEKARTLRMFATVLLGEDSLRLANMEELIKVPQVTSAEPHPKEDDSEAVSAEGPLYKVVDLTDWTITDHDTIPDGGWTDEYKTSQLVLRRISAGTFTIDPNFDGKFVSRIVITQDYYIGVFPVTEQQWKCVTGYSVQKLRGCWVESNGERFPVVDVSWNFCDKFTKLLTSQLKGMRFRLPTEAQWEYACRAGVAMDKMPRIIADSWQAREQWREYGWFDDSRYCGKMRVYEVGLKPPNGWGLYDMFGNVNEFCADWFVEPGYYMLERQDPAGPTLGPGGSSTLAASKTCKGGCAGDSQYTRTGLPVNESNSQTGFRLCCSTF